MGLACQRARDTRRPSQSVALVHKCCSSDEQPDTWTIVTGGGARCRDAVESASEVQDEISRWELARLRASTRPARRHLVLALRRRDGRMDTSAVRSTRRAEEVLGSCDRDGVDTEARIRVAASPSEGLPAVGTVVDACRSRSPDHTTLSRRSQHLNVELHIVPADEPLHLIVDSTGLSIVGEGEWAAVKHGGRGTRGWKKLHFGVDGSGAIVAQVLTDGSADDAKTALKLIDAVKGNISRFTADGAYDTIAIYEAAGARGAEVVVPPTKTAAVSRRRPRASVRDCTITRVKKIGRRLWKKESGYHRQARVENAFFRYKSIIGDRLRARNSRAQETEVMTACNILNRMTEAGRPASFSIGP